MFHGSPAAKPAVMLNSTTGLCILDEDLVQTLTYQIIKINIMAIVDAKTNSTLAIAEYAKAPTPATSLHLPVLLSRLPSFSLSG